MSRPPGKAGVDAGECVAGAWDLGAVPVAREETRAARSAAEAPAAVAPPEADRVAALAEVAGAEDSVAAEVQRADGAATAPR